MGFVYVISNAVNPKQYVGLTERSIEQRWNEHLRDTFRKNPNGTHYRDCAIHRAMRKYGAEYFWVEQLEECTSDKLDEREIFWIDYLDTFYHRYNETKGGRNNSFQEDYSRLKCTYKNETVIYNSTEELGDLLSLYRGFSKTTIKNNLRKIPDKATTTYLGIKIEKLINQKELMNLLKKKKNLFFFILKRVLPVKK